MALAGEDKEMRMPGALLYDPQENLDREHHLMHPGGGGATPAPPGYSGAGSKPKSSSAAVAGYGRSNSINSTSGVRYRECLKNHAANIGGNVTDGCGEFMPSGEDGSLEAFKCAACDCHRNFHRKEGGGGENNANSNAAMVVHPLQLPPPPPLHGGNLHSNSHWTSMVHPMKMAFGGGSAATDSSSEEELNFNVFQSGAAAGAAPPQFVLAKKRHRTKFSQDQKEKMLAFAEKLGWRIPREDDTEVQRFCGEVGVKRQVFKVWMHNNKNSSSSAKKTTTPGDNQEHQQQLHQGP